jgi:FlaA1/EpsC-like NDP-sugar epimerase
MSIFTSHYLDHIRQRIKQFLPLMIGDMLIITFSYLLMFSIRLQGGSYNTRYTGWFIASAVVLTVISIYSYRGYHRVWQQTSGYIVLSLVWAVALPNVILLLVNMVIIPRPIPLSVIFAASILSLTGIVAIRYQSRLFSAVSWQITPNTTSIEDLQRVLIVGAGESGGTLARRLQHHIRSGQNYQIIGFIDDNPAKKGLDIEGRPVLGARQDIPHIAKENAISLIIVAIHNIEGVHFRDILSYCEKTTARIKVVPDMMALLDATFQSAPIRDVQPEDLIGRSVIERHSSVDLSPVMNKRVLVTGAAGSIGSELVRQLATYNPVKLIMVDNNESALHDLFISLTAQYPYMDILHVLCDVTDKHGMKQLFEDQQPQAVFHTAAYKHVPILEAYPNQAVHVNIGGTLNVATLAYEHQAERFVLISTDKAVHPSSVMGASKRLCEYIVHAYANMDTSTYYTAVRFGNVLGSRGSVVPTFNEQIDHGGPVTVTDPEMTRYFMSISEAVNLVIHAACMTHGDEIFLLRMGETVKILDIAERMIRLRGLRPYDDIPIEFVGMRPGEKLHEELHHDTEQPSETIHPSIFKLNGWESVIPPEDFFEQVKHLIQTGLPAGRNPIHVILDILQMDYSTED